MMATEYDPYNDDFLGETIRQYDLEVALGQVACRGLHNGWPACPFCKAVL